MSSPKPSDERTHILLVEDTPRDVRPTREAFKHGAIAYDLHANEYLTKPVDPDVFIEMVRTFERVWLSLVHLPTGEN